MIPASTNWRCTIDSHLRGIPYKHQEAVGQCELLHSLFFIIRLFQGHLQHSDNQIHCLSALFIAENCLCQICSGVGDSPLATADEHGQTCGVDAALYK